MATLQDVIISVENVTMEYNLARERIDSVKEYIIKKIKGQITYDKFLALQDISFTIKRGDSVGIVGLNGSGKSTLLKLISKIMPPSKGEIIVRGSVSPLLELGAGFDYDMTAYENIFLNGATLGYSRKFIRSQIDEIIDFSELDNFMDVPIKNFSSGMVARLGFSIATLIKPDILIIDEVLSVGDYQFQQKCEKKMTELLSDGATLLFVSHTTSQVSNLCQNVIWLDQGQIRLEGDAKTVCELYESI